MRSNGGVLVSPHLPSVFDGVIQYLTTNPGKVMLLGGNRGCGKSVIGSLVVVLLAIQGRIVLYEHKGKQMIVISKNLTTDQRQLLDERFGGEGYSNLPREGGVFIIKSKDVDLWSILTSSNVIIVHDLGDTGKESPLVFDGKGTHLLISSPNATKLKNAQRLPTLKRLFVPTWSLDELLALDSLVPSSVIQSRFERMGGVPRWVIDSSEGHAEKVQDGQITNLRKSDLEIVMRSTIYEYLPTQVGQNEVNSTDLLFRIEPKEDDNSECIAVLTSPYVEKGLAYRFADEMEEEVLKFAAGVANIPTLATYRGHLLEARAHKTIMGGGEFKYAELTNKGWKDLGSIKLSKSTPVVFKNWTELSEIRMNEYIRPKNKNFESVDSFIVLDQKLVDPASRSVGPCIVGYQITSGLKHKVNGSGMKRVAAHVVAHLKDDSSQVLSPDEAGSSVIQTRSKRELPIYLTFVVGSLGTLQKKQVIKKDNGDDMIEDGFVKKQFVMSLGEGYQRLYEICQQ